MQLAVKICSFQTRTFCNFGNIPLSCIKVKTEVIDFK